MVGQVFDRKYRIVEFLGGGHLSEVYGASRLGPTEVPVAIRLFRVADGHPGLLREQLDQVLRAAEATTRLSSPHVVKVSAVSRNPPYIEMERLRGEELGAHFQARGRPMDPLEVAHVVLPVLDALEEAHAAGVLHLNIKPSNLYLVGKFRVPKVLDFATGWTTAPNQELTVETAQLLRRPLAYMAKEQLFNPEGVGPWTDVYGLGVVMFEVLSGRCPYEHTDRERPFDVALRIGTGRFLPLDQANPELSGHALVDVVHRCLAAEPGKRFQTAAALRAAMLSALTGSRKPGAAKRAADTPSDSGRDRGESCKPRPDRTLPPRTSAAHGTTTSSGSREVTQPYVRTRSKRGLEDRTRRRGVRSPAGRGVGRRWLPGVLAMLAMLVLLGAGAAYRYRWHGQPARDPACEPALLARAEERALSAQRARVNHDAPGAAVAYRQAAEMLRRCGLARRAQRFEELVTSPAQQPPEESQARRAGQDGDGRAGPLAAAKRALALADRAVAEGAERARLAVLYGRAADAFADASTVLRGAGRAQDAVWAQDQAQEARIKVNRFHKVHPRSKVQDERPKAPKRPASPRRRRTKRLPHQDPPRSKVAEAEAAFARGCLHLRSSMAKSRLQRPLPTVNVQFRRALQQLSDAERALDERGRAHLAHARTLAEKNEYVLSDIRYCR
ncbi:MAG: protein kinase [Myxococcales bacterium]|nr:protein kinase [Myxococcales bacterium]